MRPLRGRCVTDGDFAGHVRACCTRPRAIHGYFIDRSAVAESVAPRLGMLCVAESTAPPSRNRQLRRRGIDSSAVAESTAPRRGIDCSASRNRLPRGRGVDCHAVAESITGTRAKPGRKVPLISDADVVILLLCALLPFHQRRRGNAACEILCAKRSTSRYAIQTLGSRPGRPARTDTAAGDVWRPATGAGVRPARRFAPGSVFRCLLVRRC